MAPKSSWHPAFMPNSAIDTKALESIEKLQQETSTPHHSVSRFEPTSTTILRDKDNSTITADDLIHHDGLEASQQGNTAHPELKNLRNALATSLASPGGVELDENPSHEGTSNHDRIEEKTDFPSEGPTPPNKHLSTMSFARTAQEVNWGEEDEVDPEWNIHRSDTDPFKSMAQSNRTNSFPQVPPAHSVAPDFEPLHSQAEDIMNEVEKEPRDLFGDELESGDADFFTQETSRSGSLAVDQQTANSFEQSYARGFQPEDEARYEEGLPLVQSTEDSAKTIAEQISGAGPAFLDDGSLVDEDFFSQAANTGPESEDAVAVPPTLERKSTIQVMKSLHFQPHEQTHQDIPEETDLESSRSSLDNATGGGIAVSTSTVLSQVLGDPDAAIHSQSDVMASSITDSGDGDLAAKWKAALAGDEFLDDEDDFLPDDEPTDVDGTAIDPAALFEDDDEGFLEDTNDGSAQMTGPPIPGPVMSSNGQALGFDSLTGSAHTNRPSSSSHSNRYLPAGSAAVPSQQQSLYAPTTPLLTDFSMPATTPSVLSSHSTPAIGTHSAQQPQPPRPELLKTQSFANQAKGGYSSPYDLPMEVVKPRKRVSMQQLNRGYSSTAAVPPPRSSSTQLPPPSRGSASSLSPPTSSQSFQPSQLQQSPDGGVSQPPKTVKKSTSGFFEDLPTSSRPKPAPRYSSGLHNGSVQTHHSPQPSNAQFPGPPKQTPHIPPFQQQSSQVLPAQGLVAPERVSPYASIPPAAMALPVPAASTRYSPAPPSQSGPSGPPPPVQQSRYSPAPPNARPSMPSYYSAPAIAPPPVLAHQPRTSSPLAHFERSHEHRPYAAQVDAASFDRRSSSSHYEPSLRPNHLSPTRELDESIPAAGEQPFVDQQSQYPAHLVSHSPREMQSVSSTPPPPQGLAMRVGNSPPRRTTSSYLPQQPNTTATFVPPPRAQTQSPNATYARPKLDTQSFSYHQRPASVEVPASPSASNAFSPSSARPRGFSQGLNYITPIDGRENDHMERWRGAPVFAWGVGGTLVTSFPKDIPRYGLNSSAPMVVRSPGDVKIRNIKDIDPLQQRLTTFPGPLKGKSKKKEVVSWLTSGIETLEREASYLRSAVTLTHEDKRTEARILLWKVLRVFIDNDGTLEGSPTVEKSVRAVLSPGIDEESAEKAPLYATGAELSGISHSSGSATRSDPVDPAAVDLLRKHLLRGDREKAVWEAVDKRLWAHAMLISNTVSKDLYKQVVQEFVQKEVRSIGDNTESLAALYEIFAGNFEESIDELVPPSARAGFQMVSTSDAVGPSKDALDGLDRWRETLGLVLSNRSIDDSQALNALGKLLSGYGRAEAAHICFLFARSFSVFGGIDDPKSSIVLVGSDHLRQPYEFDREMEPILLSEVFEYGMSLSSTTNNSSSSPHLSVYKLQHATFLAEYGYRENALQYCEAVASSITSQTRRSPYHNVFLVSALDDLSKRLKSSPKDGSSSWISKPSIDKVSGSVWATFNKFVAGDENESSATGSASGSATESGPFARIAGGTPTISRSPSTTDIYGSHGLGIGINGAMSNNVASSRYAPGAAYSPPTNESQLGTSYGSQPRSSLEGRSPSDHRRGQYEPQRQVPDYRPDSQSSSNNFLPQTSSSHTPQQSYTPYGNDAQYAGNSSPYSLQPSTPSTDHPTTLYISPQPVNTYDGEHPASSYVPLDTSAISQTPEFQPSSGGYEPPSSSTYEPYQPASIDEPDSPGSTRPKKKSFLDDDEDDFSATKPPSGEKTKADNDRDADEAFRKAAEADAAKGAEAQPAKKGWGLGGWFGSGAKKEADMSQPNKPIRAKLGEASSFYYDPEQKRWINKKGGAENTPTPSATPPPPKAGPPRVVSGPPGANFTSAPRLSSGPPQRPASRSSDLDGTSQDASGSAPLPARVSGSAAPPATNRSASNGSAGPPTAPPSRPGTGMSNASSIDDLLGPPIVGGRKPAGKKAKKGRGYIDVMGDKAAGS